MRNYDYKEQIQRRKELQKMDFISGVQAGRLIRHFLNTFEPDITVKRFRKRYKELQKDLREDVPHKVLYSSRGHGITGYRKTCYPFCVIELI